MKKTLKSEIGITLIALVITIIVLLILAGVSIAMLTGDNGILNQANRASTETAHSAIYEAVQLENADYILDKKANNYTGTFIDYLLGKEYIEKKEGIDGYIIKAEKLTNTKQKYGNGTDGKTDVYKLEEISISSSKKVASIEKIAVAEVENNGNKTYRVVYYGKTEDEEVELGTITDNSVNSVETFQFTIENALDDGGTYTGYAESGMTWKEWIGSKYDTLKTLMLKDDQIKTSDEKFALDRKRKDIDWETIVEPDDFVVDPLVEYYRLNKITPPA